MSILNDYSERKIKDVCRCAGIFLKYILLKRDGFQTYKEPYISISIIKYIIKEILNCKLPLDNGLIGVPSHFTNTTTKYIREYSGVNNLTIDEDVVEYLWKYINACTSKLKQGTGDNAEIESRLKAYQQLINETDLDIDESFNKSLLYITICLADWLELSAITENEILYSLQILLPEELIKYTNNNYTPSYVSVLWFKNKLQQNNFTYDIKNSLITAFSTLNEIKTLEDEELIQKFNTRTRYFAK